MYPFHIRVKTYQLSRNNLVILPPQGPVSLYCWSDRTSLPFAAGAIGRVQNIFCDAGNFVRHAIEARKIIDINEHQSLRSLQDIYSVEVKTKYLSYATCQLQHFTAYRYLL